jgi:hypothetical protein
MTVLTYDLTLTYPLLNTIPVVKEGDYHAVLFNYLVKHINHRLLTTRRHTTKRQWLRHTANHCHHTRLALLIGNDNYDKNANKLKLGALNNPVNDAYDMASALKGR